MTLWVRTKRLLLALLPAKVAHVDPNRICLACGLFQCEDCADEYGCCCGRIGSKWDEPCYGCGDTVGDCSCPFYEEEDHVAESLSAVRSEQDGTDG